MLGSDAPQRMWPSFVGARQGYKTRRACGAEQARVVSPDRCSRRGPSRPSGRVRARPQGGDAPCVTDLVAGQTLTVGTVSVEQQGTDLVVTYQIAAGSDWYLTETHLYLGTEPPAKPSPGACRPKTSAGVRYNWIFFVSWKTLSLIN